MKERIEGIVARNPMFYKKEFQTPLGKIWVYGYHYFNPVEFFAEKDLLKKELRGIAITEEGEIFPSIHKFFNVGEHPLVPSWNEVESEVKAWEKLDGSLITPILMGGKVVFKSRNSLNSDVAKIAERVATPYLKEAIKELLRAGYYPQFELISPQNRVVVTYSEESLKLIAVRKREGNSFVYMQDELKNFARELKVDYAKEFIFSKRELQKLQKEAKGIEGWVIQSGEEFLKVKTDWYFRLHKYNPQNLREKEILQAILEENIDDILSLVRENYGEEYYSRLKNYVDGIYRYISERVKEIEKAYTLLSKMEIPEFARSYPYLTKYIKPFKLGIQPLQIVKEELRKLNLKEIRSRFGSVN